MGENHRSDPALIQACLSRDQSAWNELVERYTRLVYSIPRRYGFSEPDADDVHQNVFRILAEKLRQLQDQTRLSSWIITTAHRECWRLRRAAQRIPALPANEQADQSLPEEAVRRLERQHLVRLGLEAVGDPCRGLLETLFLQPAAPPYETIAHSLGMKVGSIGPTRARCLQKLEAILRELGMEGWDE